MERIARIAYFKLLGICLRTGLALKRQAGRQTFLRGPLNWLEWHINEWVLGRLRIIAEDMFGDAAPEVFMEILLMCRLGQTERLY